MPSYSVPPKHVVSEVIDGEAIIMDLRTGLYFSADGSGAVIWDGIAAGQDVATVAAGLRGAWPEAAGRAEADVAAFVAALVENNLLLPRDGAAPAEGWAPALPASPGTYAPPVLERHGDMQDLAALDPIHDVEETGWPNRRTTF